MEDEVELEETAVSTNWVVTCSHLVSVCLSSVCCVEDTVLPLLSLTILVLTSSSSLNVFINCCWEDSIFCLDSADVPNFSVTVSAASFSVPAAALTPETKVFSSVLAIFEVAVMVDLSVSKKVLSSVFDAYFFSRSEMKDITSWDV